MFGFYTACALFVFVILGTLLWLVARINIFSLFRYLAREFLLIVATSSSESALPRLIAKMEHIGVSRSTVGVVVPTGYSFNLDGTAIYLTMASLFIATAMGDPLTVGEQISLLVFMMIASKGAAGVTGAGLATLAGGLASHRPELIDGVGLIVGIDRFMSEARAVTNFAGNAIATLVIGTWTQSVDHDQVTAGPRRRRPVQRGDHGRRRPRPRRRGRGPRTRAGRRQALIPDPAPPVPPQPEPADALLRCLTHGVYTTREGTEECVSGFVAVSGRGRPPRRRC